jgi:hypothetical protein
MHSYGAALIPNLSLSKERSSRAARAAGEVRLNWPLPEGFSPTHTVPLPHPPLGQGEGIKSSPAVTQNSPSGRVRRVGSLRWSGRSSAGMRCRRGLHSRVLATVTTAATIASLLLWPPRARAAVIDKAWAVQRGAVVELHFGLHGRGLRWELSTHGDQLWIELARTRLDLPPRPLYGHETAPVELVRAIDEGGVRSRLVIQVAGRTDYAVGLLPHELLVRLAPAGQVPDLAAPVLVRRERRAVRAAAGRPATPAAGGGAGAMGASGMRLSALRPRDGGARATRTLPGCHRPGPRRL